MSRFFIHAATCVPDAGFFEIPIVEVPYEIDEASVPLRLECEESEKCPHCARKRRRTSFHAYPVTTQPIRLPQSSGPQPRGCRKFLLSLSHILCCYRSKRRYQLITRYRYSKQKKPYTAISVHVEQLTSETYEEDDLAGIPDLLEVVRLQGTGPTEVARALRKKLKYGNVHRQLRALTILDGLLQNGSERLQRTILSDAPLLERLRIAAVDPVSDQDVRAKCKVLFGQWVASSGQNHGLEGAKSLYNQLPKKQKAPQQRREQSKVLRETEEDARRDDELEESRSRSASVAAAGEPSSPATLRKSSIPVGLGSASTFGTRKVKKDKKSKKQAFNLEREKPAILQSIAAASVASTNLNNALKLVNRESKRVSDDPEVMNRFETCKQLRRQVLRYIQYVETDEFLGGLIHANEELVASLMSFEVLDKSVDDDSDSELEEAQHLSRQAAKAEASATRDAEKLVAGLSISGPPKPPRPSNITMPPRPSASTKNWKSKQVESDDESDTEVEDDDSDDPFGDKNVLVTPDPDSATGGRKGFSFKEI